MNTPEEYFKKWAENCRIFTNYKAIHSHEDMMRFAKDYHTEQLRLNGVIAMLNDVKGMSFEEYINVYDMTKIDNDTYSYELCLMSKKEVFKMYLEDVPNI